MKVCVCVCAPFCQVCHVDVNWGYMSSSWMSSCYPPPLPPRTYNGTLLQCSWFFITSVTRPSGFPANLFTTSLL